MLHFSEHALRIQALREAPVGQQLLAIQNRFEFAHHGEPGIDLEVTVGVDEARTDPLDGIRDQGADVLYQNTDSPAVVQLAQSKGLYAFGQDSDMTRFGPQAHLTGNVLNWGVYYVHKVRQMLDGKWKPEDTKWGMKEGIVQLAPLNPALPRPVVDAVESRRADIVAGRFQPFSGEIRDQAGKVQVVRSTGVVKAAS